MADLVLMTHGTCEGVYCDPDADKIGRLKPDAILTPRRAADLLRVPMEDLQELVDAGAVATVVDDSGRTVITGGDLQRFTKELRPVTFTETEAEGARDGAEEGDAPAASARRAKAPAGPAMPAPSPAAVTVVASAGPASDATRVNPAPASGAQGDAPEAGWVRLRLSDLAALIRGESAAAPQGR